MFYEGSMLKNKLIFFTVMMASVLPSAKAEDKVDLVDTKADSAVKVKGDVVDLGITVLETWLKFRRLNQPQAQTVVVHQPKPLESSTKIVVNRNPTQAEIDLAEEKAKFELEQFRAEAEWQKERSKKLWLQNLKTDVSNSWNSACNNMEYFVQQPLFGVPHGLPIAVLAVAGFVGYKIYHSDYFNQ